MVGAVTSTLTCIIDVDALLPALSIALPAMVWFAPSPTSTGGVQLATPDSESPQVKVTVGLPVAMLYQPVTAGLPGVMVRVIVGFVLSMLIPLTVEESAVFPALSVQLPVLVTNWPAPSPLSVVPATVSVFTPDCTKPTSAQAKLTATSVLFQLWALANGTRLPVIIGFVLSILMPVTDAGSLTLSALSLNFPDAVWLIPSLLS